MRIEQNFAGKFCARVDTRMRSIGREEQKNKYNYDATMMDIFMKSILSRSRLLVISETLLYLLSTFTLFSLSVVSSYFFLSCTHVTPILR